MLQPVKNSFDRPLALRQRFLFALFDGNWTQDRTSGDGNPLDTAVFNCCRYVNVLRLQCSVVLVATVATAPRRSDEKADSNTDGVSRVAVVCHVFPLINTLRLQQRLRRCCSFRGLAATRQDGEIS